MKIFKWLFSIGAVVLAACAETYWYLVATGQVAEFMFLDIFFKGGTLDGARLSDFRLTAIALMCLINFICVEAIKAREKDDEQREANN